MQRFETFYKTVSDYSLSSSGALTVLALEFAKAVASEQGRIVLVEGVSDFFALNALAECRGWDLNTMGVTIVPIGGARNVGRFLELLGPHGMNVKPAGLCDAGEEEYFRRALTRAGFGSTFTRQDMEALGFFVCTVDLEDELIRCVGVETVLNIAAAEGELGAFRTFQRQPQWQGQSEEAQLRRWLGVTTRRKFRYSKLLVEALDPHHMPRPLDQLLIHVSRMT